MTEPRWLQHARSLEGTQEAPGPRNEPRIMAMAKRAAGWLGVTYLDDKTPWCGLFVADCMAVAGFKPPRGFVGVRAKAWASWGIDLGKTSTRPALGSVAVFGRDGGGHVGFVTGVYNNGDLAILGGNQGDAVNVRRFPRARLLAIRWPAGVAVAAPAPWVEGGIKTTGEA